MTGLLIPVALDETGQPVYPAAALPGTAYRCSSASCGAEVRLRRGYARTDGVRVQAHFYHLTSEADRACGWSTGESLEHWQAKEALRAALPAGVCFHRRCGTCGSVPLTTVRGSTVGVEVPLLVNGTTYRVDVATLDPEGKPEFLIEVRHLHAVPPAKIEALAGHRWVEVAAAAVLGGHSMEILAGTLRIECKTCREREERRREQEALRLELQPKVAKALDALEMQVAQWKQEWDALVASPETVTNRLKADFGALGRANWSWATRMYDLHAWGLSPRQLVYTNRILQRAGYRMHPEVWGIDNPKGVAFLPPEELALVWQALTPDQRADVTLERARKRATTDQARLLAEEMIQGWAKRRRPKPSPATTTEVTDLNDLGGQPVTTTEILNDVGDEFGGGFDSLFEDKKPCLRQLPKP